MLLTRVGLKKKRLWPWFEPIAAGAPMKYEGWYWDPAEKEWLPSEMAKIKVEVGKILYPKPTKMPSREFSSEQPGWSYSFTTFKWVQTIVLAEPVEFQPPLPMPPVELTPEIELAYSYVTDWSTMQQMLVKMGMSGAELDVFMNRVNELLRGLSGPAREAMKYEIISRVVRSWKLGRGVFTRPSGYLWNKELEKLAREYTPEMRGITTIAVAAVVAAAIGYIMGRLLDMFVTPEKEDVTLDEPIGTYLMRYDHYLYSRMIAISRKRKPYYSACEDIGTSWIRHRRPRRREGIDIIDFPGGFVEEGHKGIYFVKYTWRYWTLEYIGMLTSLGKNLYVLREGNRDTYAMGKATFMLPESEWCKGFRWYL